MSIVGQGPRRDRIDIQALRGFAVIAVVLFHSGLGILPSGYLGVDVFFVVSGFLISGIIMRQMTAGSFSFADFYSRRIRRLIPASHLVLLACIVAGWLILSAGSFEQFWQQTLGALAFSANVVLWKQINYFNNASENEPLLHMWSLAVEEQFYLILPIVLLLTPRRMWFWALLLATGASLAAYLLLYPLSPGFAFYLLPTRAWEIGLGALANFVIASSSVARTARRLVWPATIALLAMMIMPSWPGNDFYLAVPTCLLTATILVANAGPDSRSGTLKPLARVGDFSYSLYLVHWPLFAFTHTIYLEAPLPPALSILLMVASIALAYPLYRFVEEPIRRAALPMRTVWLGLIGSTLIVATAGYLVLHAKRAVSDGEALRGVQGLALTGCSSDTILFDARCSQSPAPEILIWGDSFSQHVIPGIDATTPRPIAQASKGQCAPFAGFAPLDFDANRHFAEDCIRFQQSVLTYVRTTPSIDVVVLSGRYSRFLQSQTNALVDDGSTPPRIMQPSLDLIDTAQARTVALLRRYGKRVVVLGAPPQARYNVGQCWARQQQHLPSIAPAHCTIANADRAEWAPALAQLMTRFGRTAPIIRLDRPLCHGATCDGIRDGQPMYRDRKHLSRAGSLVVGQALNLGTRVWDVAR